MPDWKFRTTIVGTFFTRLVEVLFLPAADRLSHRVELVWAGLLYLGGSLHWMYFFNWGRVPFDLHDWTQTGAYYSFLRAAVLSGKLPLHMPAALVTTDRYLGRPDTLFSPQGLLLAIFPPGPFMVVNTLVMFTIGCLGLWMLKKRYHLAPVPFAALFLLFNFNGHITAHLSVGHSEWVGYFLLPFFVILILKLVEGEKVGWGWVTGMSLLLLGFFLQGAFHFVLWCLIFIAALGMFYPRFAAPCVKAILFGILVSMVRILPPAMTFFGGGTPFLSGFVSVTDLVSALVVLKAPAEALRGPFNALGWWEIDTYIGLIGLAFLLFYGIYRTLKRNLIFRPLFAPIFVLALLSIGKIYYPITRLPFPLADSERITSRFLIVPLVFLVVLAAVALQRALTEAGKRGIRERLLFLSLLLLLGHDLFQHSRIWRVTNLYLLFPRTPVDITSPVLNHPDPPYTTALAIGAVLSLLTIALLVALSWRERHRTTQLNP